MNIGGTPSIVFFSKGKYRVLGKKQNSPADPNVNTLFRRHFRHFLWHNGYDA